MILTIAVKHHTNQSNKNLILFVSEGHILRLNFKFFVYSTERKEASEQHLLLFENSKQIFFLLVIWVMQLGNYIFYGCPYIKDFLNV